MLTYVKYLMNDKSLASLDEYSRYTLIYIDSDDIPEMVLQGESDGEGLCVLTQYKGNVFRMNTTGLNLSFIEKSSLFINYHCGFGECGEEIYRLQAGEFVMTDVWRSEDNSVAADFFESDGADSDETEIEEEIKFYFNDKATIKLLNLE